MNIHLPAIFYVHQGYKVLTHCHIDNSAAAAVHWICLDQHSARMTTDRSVKFLSVNMWVNMWVIILLYMVN